MNDIFSGYVNFIDAPRRSLKSNKETIPYCIMVSHRLYLDIAAMIKIIISCMLFLVGNVVYIAKSFNS